MTPTLEGAVNSEAIDGLVLSQKKAKCGVAMERDPGYLPSVQRSPLA